MRIIPTRVGTSLHAIVIHKVIEDHPHACGDKRSASSLSTLVRGSSPRVWGQEEKAESSIKSARIIPTRVGTSGIGCGSHIDSWDHPHACGDKGGAL